MLQNKDNFDVGNSNSDWKDQDDEAMQKSISLLRRDSVQELFNEYYFDETVAAALNSQNNFLSGMAYSSRNTAPATSGLATTNHPQ